MGMSKNRSGHLTGNIEWGSKGRKEEDALRGRNQSARRAAIEDQLAEADVDDIVLIEPDVEFEDRPWFDQGDGFDDYDPDDLDWIDAQFFDEPQ